MSNIKAGNVVEFTGFKEQDAIDTASVDELELMYPLMSAGCWFVVQSVCKDGALSIMLEGEFDSSLPTYLFPNEVKLVG